MAERNPSKQRRAAQNKAQREALANRRARASQPSRSAPEPPDGAVSPTRRTRSGGKSKPAEAPTGRNGRPARTPRATPVRRVPTNPVMKRIAMVQSVAGGKGVFFALMFSLVAGGMVLFTKVTPREVMIAPAAIVNEVRLANDLPVPGELDPVIASDYAWNVIGPVSIVVALAPVLIAGVAFFLAGREGRRRNFTIAAFAMGMVVFLSGALGIYYMFAFGGLVYGAYKARQADPLPGRGARRRKDDEDDEPVEDDLEDDETA